MNLLQVTSENRSRVRAFYLSLCDQGRANFLYDNLIGGAALMLDPDQYPKAAPLHRICSCGCEPELVGSIHIAKGDLYVKCPNCGCRGETEKAPHLAWRAWDVKRLRKEANLTIWDVD